MFLARNQNRSSICHFSIIKGKETEKKKKNCPTLVDGHGPQLCTPQHLLRQSKDVQKKKWWRHKPLGLYRTLHGQWSTFYRVLLISTPTKYVPLLPPCISATAGPFMRVAMKMTVCALKSIPLIYSCHFHVQLQWNFRILDFYISTEKWKK